MPNLISSILLSVVAALIIYSLYILFKKSNVKGDKKVIWILIIFMMPLIGAILFLYFNHRKD